MGGNRRWWVALGVAAVVIATGCGERDDAQDQAGVRRPAVKQTTTTSTVAASVPETTTVRPETPDRTVPRPRVTTTTTNAAPTTTTTTVAPPPVQDLPPHHEPPPTVVDELPWMTVSPSRAVAGTRVFLDGYGFTADHWQSHGQLWLSIAGGQSSCHLVAKADSQVFLEGAGRLFGSFVVPETGICRFTKGEEMNTAGYSFDIAYQCTACFVGTFFVEPEVTTPAITGTYCFTMAASHGAVDRAEVYADGLPCDHDDVARVLKGAWAWAPVTGPQHVDDAAGFTCDRISESTAVPPTATYKCVKGSQVIWFLSTGRS